MSAPEISITARRKCGGRTQRPAGGSASFCGSTGCLAAMASDIAARCSGLLFVLSTIGYMWWGMRLKDGSSSLTWTYPWINPWDWLRAAYYSFRVMTLPKPDDWVPLRYAQLVNAFQTLLGPTFLGLFALALRQRSKRYYQPSSD